MTEFRQIENFDDFEVGRMYYWREMRTGKLGMFTHYEGHKLHPRFEWGPMVPTADELTEMMNNMHDALDHLETMCEVADKLADALNGRDNSIEIADALTLYDETKETVNNGT